MKVRQTDVYKKWFARLRDQRARARIAIRIKRLAAGNPGDVASVGQGVSELRVDYGPGYRVYYKKIGKDIVLLLAGGDKSTQAVDVSIAKNIARNLI